MENLSLVSILEIHSLSTGASKALIGLLSFRNPKTDDCNPSMAMLCERLDAPNRTVRRWLQELRQSGTIAVKRRGAHTNSYTFLKEVAR